MHTIRILLLALVTLMAVSCTIEMNMFVKSDYTGDMEIKIDISEMIAFMGPLDSLSQEEKDIVFAEMNPGNEVTAEDRAILEESGLTNLEFDVDEEFITMTYDYSDINNAYDLFYVLDSSMTDEERMQMMESENFKVEDDRLTITFKDDGLSDMVTEGMGGDGSDGDEDGEVEPWEEDMDMSFMMNLFTMKQSYTFERPVIDVIDDDLPIRVKGNRIYFTINFTEYLEEFVGNEIVVVFDEGKKKKKR